jgi:hypothetical protein
MVLVTSFPGFKPDKFPLLQPNCLVGDIIAKISMKLSTNQPGLVIFTEILGYLPLRTRIPHAMEIKDPRPAPSGNGGPEEKPTPHGQTSNRRLLLYIRYSNKLFI